MKFASIAMGAVALAQAKPEDLIKAGHLAGR